MYIKYRISCRSKYLNIDCKQSLMGDVLYNMHNIRINFD